MDFKCVQDFELIFGTCSELLFQFSGNMAAIMSQCRVFRRNVDFFRSNIEKSSRDCQNILGGVLMHGMYSEILPEHIEKILGSVFTWPIFMSRGPDIPIQGERLKSSSR